MPIREVTALPHEITTEKHLWIPTADGTRLSGRLWRPRSSDRRPVPAVCEYIPYRKRDLTAVRDSVHHPYLAGHGYACLRVDVRGTGDSEGVLTDEYLEREQLDAEDVLAWLAQQPWCDGRIGMMGVSWGGFSALQVAARRPPNLRAIAISCCTDQRYGDDFHYQGGSLLLDNFAESGTMFAAAACPPDPAVVGPGWREMWLERLEHSRPWVGEWLAHQRRDDYWRHASVDEDYAAVQCPVLATGGWADGYSGAVPRLLEHLDVPRKGIIGPWAHRYPHLGEPGPAIGYLQELVRWWNRWLYESDAVDDDVLDGPVLQVWMQQSVPPAASYVQRHGRWVGEPSWPSPNVRPRTHPLAPQRIGEPGEEPAAGSLSLRSPLSVGRFAGKWASYGTPPDLPGDQRPEDEGSLVFDTEPLAEDVEILGEPVAELDVAADRPTAMVAVRLSDVAPDGRATRVTYGLLNLTHREGHEHPQPLKPGRRYRVEVTLGCIAQSFPAGHRIRLSLSTSYWPLAWPAPQPASVSVHLGGAGVGGAGGGGSTLTLPIRAVDAAEEPPVRKFGEPEGAPALATVEVEPGEARWTVPEDAGDGEDEGADSPYDIEIVKDMGVRRFEEIEDLEVARRVYERYGRTGDDVQSANAETLWTTTFSRDHWSASTVTHTELACTDEDFLLRARIEGYEGERLLFSRGWEAAIPRDQL